MQDREREALLSVYDDLGVCDVQDAMDAIEYCHCNRPGATFPSPTQTGSAPTRTYDLPADAGSSLLPQPQPEPHSNSDPAAHGGALASASTYAASHTPARTDALSSPRIIVVSIPGYVWRQVAEPRRGRSGVSPSRS